MGAKARRNILSSMGPWPLKVKITIMVLGGVVICILALLLPPAIDWHVALRPAALALLAGESPYSVEGFFGPPWALFPLIPLAVLPEPVGRASLLVMAIVSYALTVRRLGGGGLAIGAIMLSPPVMIDLLSGNINWLVALGLIMPPWLGLFLVTVKPQMGIAVIVFWLIEAWRRDRGWGVVRDFAPVAVAFLLSLAFWGLWPLRAGILRTFAWNASLWPLSLPVGLALLVAALRRRDLRYAMGASPCLTPYIGVPSWSVALLALVTAVPELVAAVIGLWRAAAIHVYG